MTDTEPLIHDLLSRDGDERVGGRGDYDLGTAWYRKVAAMDRESLFETLEREAQIRGTLSERLIEARNKLDEAIKRGKDELRAEREKPIYFICSAYHHAEYGRMRMGLDSKRFHTVNTNDMASATRLHGLRLRPDDFRLVRDWRKGRYAREVEQVLERRGVSVSAIGYAPDAHYDMVDDGSYADAIIREYEYRTGGAPTIKPGEEFNVTCGQHSEGPFRVDQVSVSHDFSYGGSTEVTVMGTKRMGGVLR